MKIGKGYRTLIFNVVTIAVTLAVGFGLIETEVAPTEEEINFFVENVTYVVVAVAATVNIVLRFFTDSPVGKKET